MLQPSTSGPLPTPVQLSSCSPTAARPILDPRPASPAGCHNITEPDTPAASARPLPSWQIVSPAPAQSAADHPARLLLPARSMPAPQPTAQPSAAAAAACHSSVAASEAGLVPEGAAPHADAPHSDAQNLGEAACERVLERLTRLPGRSLAAEARLHPTASADDWQVGCCCNSVVVCITHTSRSLRFACSMQVAAVCRHETCWLLQSGQPQWPDRHLAARHATSICYPPFLWPPAQHQQGPTASQHHACMQVLSAVELARKARIAANRAYLASITGQDPATAAQGTTSAEAAAQHTVPDKAGEAMLALPIDHALVLRAARRLADAAAAQEARTQVPTFGPGGCMSAPEHVSCWPSFSSMPSTVYHQ